MEYCYSTVFITIYGFLCTIGGGLIAIVAMKKLWRERK